jgi:hypothetical protein
MLSGEVPDRSSEERRLEVVATQNRERIRVLEAEVRRLRDRVHELEPHVIAVHYFAEQLAEFARQLERFGARLDTFGRRTLGRPTAAGLGAAAGWLAGIVALVLLIVTLAR